MAFSSVVVVAGDEFGMDAFADIVENFGIEFATNYRQSVELIDLLFDSFPVNRAGELVYPENFGGVYFDEFGNLNVLVVEPVFASFEAQEASAFNVFTAEIAQLVNVRYAQFSIAELWATIDLLNELIPSKWDSATSALNVQRWYIDVIRNRVVIELIEFNDEAVEMFRREVIDLPIVIFEESLGRIELFDEGFLQEMYAAQNLENDVVYYNTSHYDYAAMGFEPANSVVVRLGDPIYVNNNGVFHYVGSVGYQAWRGSSRGFVTTAHSGFGLRAQGFIAGDRVYASGGRHIGVVEFAQLQGHDTAFVRLNGTVQFNNTASIPVGRSTVNVSGMTGRAIRARGATTPGVRTGQILAIGLTDVFELFFGGPRFTVVNLVQSSMWSQRGDSGGIVYMHQPNTNDTSVLGIHVGSGAGTSYAVVADNINALFGMRMNP